MLSLAHVCASGPPQRPQTYVDRRSDGARKATRLSSLLTVSIIRCH
jgi:hypothetical protein